MGKRTQVNKFDIVGRVIFVGMPTFISERYSKRVLILEVYVENKYKKEVEFTFSNDNMNLLDNIRKEDWVHIGFNLAGNKQIQRDGKAKWWPTIEGTACQKVD